MEKHPTKLHDRPSKRAKKTDADKPSIANSIPTRHSSEIEGEGSYSAARKYDGAVRDFVKSGQVPDSANEARRAIESAEADELKRAEEAGKRGKSDKA